MAQSFLFPQSLKIRLEDSIHLHQQGLAGRLLNSAVVFYLSKVAPEEAKPWRRSSCVICQCHGVLEVGITEFFD